MTKKTLEILEGREGDYCFISQTLEKKKIKTTTMKAAPFAVTMAT